MSCDNAHLNIAPTVWRRRSASRSIPWSAHRSNNSRKSLRRISSACRSMIDESARFRRLSISFAVLRRPTTLRLTYSSIGFSTVSREAAAARLSSSSATRSRPVLAALVSSLARSRAFSRLTSQTRPNDNRRVFPKLRIRYAKSQVLMPLGATRTARPMQR
jgi:hypothetical protein